MTEFDSFLSKDRLGYAFSQMFFSLIDMFFPSGELISQHLLRCGAGRLGRFEVDNHVFMGRRLASAANSTRERYKLHIKFQG
jgi:hypothetical protein